MIQFYFPIILVTGLSFIVIPCLFSKAYKARYFDGQIFITVLWIP